MPEPWCAGISCSQEERIKRAVENTCELCHEYMASPLLCLHGLSGEKEQKGPSPKERERNVIVVCEPCHRLIHGQPVPQEKLRERISARPFRVRREILLALGYLPKPLAPPDHRDYTRMCADIIEEFAGRHR